MEFFCIEERLLAEYEPNSGCYMIFKWQCIETVTGTLKGQQQRSPIYPPVIAAWHLFLVSRWDFGVSVYE